MAFGLKIDYPLRLGKTIKRVHILSKELYMKVFTKTNIQVNLVEVVNKCSKLKSKSVTLLKYIESLRIAKWFVLIINFSLSLPLQLIVFPIFIYVVWITRVLTSLIFNFSRPALKIAIEAIYLSHVEPYLKLFQFSWCSNIHVAWGSVPTLSLRTFFFKVLSSIISVPSFFCRKIVWRHLYD